jgi:hypothetical protein
MEPERYFEVEILVLMVVDFVVAFLAVLKLIVVALLQPLL